MEKSESPLKPIDKSHLVEDEWALEYPSLGQWMLTLVNQIWKPYEFLNSKRKTHFKRNVNHHIHCTTLPPTFYIYSNQRILSLGFCNQMATNSWSGELRKPVFVKVESLKPGTNGHTLLVKVVNSNMVLQKGRAVSPHTHNIRIAECVVGDDTGTILFTARNDQGMHTFVMYIS